MQADALVAEAEAPSPIRVLISFMHAAEVTSLPDLTSREHVVVPMAIQAHHPATIRAAPSWLLSCDGLAAVRVSVLESAYGRFRTLRALGIGRLP
jgi:hypothetical protein